MIHAIQDINQFWWKEYSAETGTMINEASAPNVSSRTAQVNWAQSKGYQAGLGILDKFEYISYRKERVCTIPFQVEWSEQAYIGDTHLVIMSPTHGVIIMKAPQDVSSFGAHSTSLECVPGQADGSSLD